jgi:hypothetical protein
MAEQSVRASRGEFKQADDSQRYQDHQQQHAKSSSSRDGSSKGANAFSALSNVPNSRKQAADLPLASAPTNTAFRNYPHAHSAPHGIPASSPVPLMPAIVGTTELCSAEFWSHDPGFMIYCYKITPCTYRTPHDWRACPWAHPSERAARRDPRSFFYSSIPCSNARHGHTCGRGTACEYSHNVTEYWLHPDRFRTEWCSLGDRCDRRLCFFAHSAAELRVVSASNRGPKQQQQQQQQQQGPMAATTTVSHDQGNTGHDDSNNQNDDLATAFDPRILQLLAAAVAANIGVAATMSPPTVAEAATTAGLHSSAASVGAVSVLPLARQPLQQQQPLPPHFRTPLSHDLMPSAGCTLAPHHHKHHASHASVEPIHVSCNAAAHPAHINQNPNTSAAHQLDQPTFGIDAAMAAPFILELLQNMPPTSMHL